MTRGVHYAVRGTVAVIRLDNPPVNGLSHNVRLALVDELEQAFADTKVSAVVLTGNDRSFSAGADIRELGTPAATSKPTLRDVIGTIERGPKPVVAAIAGVCLGGGFELALGCHARVSTPVAVVGLPEVKLGLLPGAGGTQRLPRAIGLEEALGMIVSGKTRSAYELAATGLFDEIASGELEAHAVSFALRLSQEENPLRRLRDEAVDDPDAERIIRDAREAALRNPKRLPAPLKCIQSAEAALGDFDEGMRFERECFDSLMATPEYLALRYRFRSERQAADIPSIAADTVPRTVERIGIVGAGTMGRGIAMAFLNAGFPVRLVDVSREVLDRGVDLIRQSYETSRSKGRLSEAECEERMRLLETAASVDELESSDLIVEAVFEDLNLKRQVFEALDASARRGAVLASNTSTLDVNLIAHATSRPEDVVGLHFFSPAHVMRLVEVVRGEKTADDVLVTSMKIAKRLGKVAVVAGICDGFIGNRMYHKYQAAAEDLLLQGASPEQVDTVLERFGMAMGPFRVGDLAGLDVGWAIRKHRAEQDPSLAVARLPDKLCEAGRFGQKTQAGWYRYETGDRTAIPDPFVEETISAFRNERGVVPREVSEEEIVAQCIGALSSEGEQILDEGIALRASDIDVVWLNGYGFPAHRGGPMYHAGQDGETSPLPPQE
jgi:3-hydroxyacyl-CoA dehydrogenase